MRWAWISIALVAMVVGLARWSLDTPLAPLGTKVPGSAPAAPRSLPPAQLEVPPSVASEPVEAGAEGTVEPTDGVDGPLSEDGSGAPAAGDSTPPAGEQARRPVVRRPVALFEHGAGDERSVDGQRWLVYAGLTDAGLAFADNQASRVEVPEGWQATLFDEHGGRGVRILLAPGNHDLNALGFNDRVSSVLVAPEGTVDRSRAGPSDKVQLHEHGLGSDVRGLRWSLPLAPGQTTRLFRAQAGDLADDAASAAWVPAGFELTLLDGAGGLGAAMVLGPGLHDLDGLRWNDRTSAARVRRLEAR